MFNRIKKIFLILFGNLLVAAATVLFIVPAGFISGGVTGFALALEQFFGFPLHYGIAVLSVTLLVVGWIFLGHEFAISTALSAVSYPLFVWGFEILVTFADITTGNIFLNLACSALLNGYGMALIIREGASSGGLDTISMILNQKLGISLVLTVNIFEVIAMMTQVYYSSTEEILGGILGTLIYTAIMNHVIEGGVSRIQVLIYSKKYEEIYEYVDTVIDRGATLFRIQGGYKREDTFAIQTVISHRQLFKLKEYVKKIDPVAFMTISEVSEVGGRGFSLAKDAPER